METTDTTTRNGGLAPRDTQPENGPSPQEGQPQAKELDEDSRLPQPPEGDWQDEQRDAKK